jgi:hypothetical protein
MKRLINLAISGFGSLVIMFGTAIAIVALRLLKIFHARKLAITPEDDVFHDSRKHPLPPALEKHDQ